MKSQATVKELQQKVKALETDLAACRSENDQLRQQADRSQKLCEEIKRSEKVYRSIIDSSADAIAIFDLNGKMTYVSPSFTQVFGWSQEEVVGKRIPFLPESEKEKTAAMVIDLTLNGTPCHSMETKRYKKDGSLIDVSLSASRFHDHAGKPEGMFVILHDISERKKLQNQLLQAQKMEALGTLAGGIAHDFNNIIFNIIGYAEMIKADVGAHSLSGQNLEEVLRAAYRARDLVRHIRTFSGQLSQDRKPIRIQHVIYEGLDLLRAMKPANVRIQHNLSESGGPVLANEAQLHQIIMNLGQNALYAMRDGGGTLRVEVSEIVIEDKHPSAPLDLTPGRYVMLAVVDTGQGMDPPVMKRIFDPFFTTKGPGEGSGMGLSVVHGIVKDYGGAIDVVSKPAKGANFTIYLPCIDAQPGLDVPSFKPSHIGAGEHILVVDEEEENVFLTQQILERLGYRVTGETSGTEALELFQKAPDKYNLVIADMAMTAMSGIELAEKLKKIRAHLPIVLCTGFSETLQREKAKKLGIRHFLMKPIVTNDLASTVKQILDAGSGRFSILVADDDATLRMMLRQHLEDSGYKVLDVSNGLKAVRLLDTESINLVLTDVRMPEMDGFELMAYIQANYPWIPVMVMSAYGTPETTKRFREMGSLQVMDKPVDLDELNRRINESLHQVSQGGAMTGISVASFLQLIEMEQKSCILEVHHSDRKKGFLYFNRGRLYDARCGELRGKAATLEMLSWDNVLLSFNSLPQKRIEKTIDVDLVTLLLESAKQKDET